MADAAICHGDRPRGESCHSLPFDLKPTILHRAAGSGQ
ncbi:hypothetical protein L838_4401 [Mycobacterium avium MAV_120709_2344]|nr:hypothetical protein L838_4401 [Mycobacterium avium MAV_120709_2344]